MDSIGGIMKNLLCRAMKSEKIVKTPEEFINAVNLRMPSSLIYLPITDF